jgi:hypothetical protein
MSGRTRTLSLVIVAVIAVATAAALAIGRGGSSPVAQASVGIPQTVVHIGAAVPHAPKTGGLVFPAQVEAQLPGAAGPGAGSAFSQGAQAGQMAVTWIPSQHNPDGSLPAVPGPAPVTGTPSSPDLSAVLSNKLTNTLISQGFQAAAGLNSLLGSLTPHP